MEVVGVLEATPAVFLEQLEDDALGGRQHVRLDGARTWGRRAPLHLEERLAIARAEGQLAREHLEEEHAERVEIALRTGLLAARLLRRHVLGRAEDGPLRREARVHREVGETEVQDLHEVLAATFGGQKDVVALEIAVDDAEVVRASQRCAHLLEDVDAPRQLRGASRELRRERRPDEVLHDEVELALLGLADVVDVDDVGVVDAVGGARLAQHPRAQVGLTPQVGPNQFQRDDAVDEDMARAVDDAHPAFANACLQTIAARDNAAHHGIDWLRRGATLGLGHHTPW